MNWKRTVTLSVLLLCIFVTSGGAFAQGKTHHVIFAVTSGDQVDWELSLANMRNLLKGFGSDPYEVELVAFGPGIMILKSNSAVAKDIKAMQDKKVQFMACENAMKFHNLTLADLLSDVHPVPSGIVELVTKQEQGWIYIKGGR
jgi:uncharacterized protein